MHALRIQGKGAIMTIVSRNISTLLKDEHISGLHGWKKIQHILTYYKFPLILLCVLLYAVGFLLHGHFTHRDVVLYTALVNVVAGEDLSRQLGEDFVDYLKLDASKNELQLYTGLYLTDDELNAYHEYTYASRMKILAVIEGKQLDVVLMNREAFDAFSQNGYLCNLAELLSEECPGLYEQVKSDLVNNIVILEDNASDIALDASLPYRALTEEYPMGLALSSRDGFVKQAGFEDKVYLGIIANSPRVEAGIAYLQYLLQDLSLQSP